MTWWQAVLSGLGTVVFWPALWLVGDRVDTWFHNRQMRNFPNAEEYERLRAERRAETGRG